MIIRGCHIVYLGHLRRFFVLKWRFSCLCQLIVEICFRFLEFEIWQMKFRFSFLTLIFHFWTEMSHLTMVKFSFFKLKFIFPRWLSIILVQWYPYVPNFNCHTYYWTGMSQHQKSIELHHITGWIIIDQTFTFSVLKN